MSAPLWPEPTWLQGLPDDERPQARLRWLLDLCAVYACPDGKMTSFSIACGLDPSTIGKAKSLGQIGPRLAIKIEALLGRDLMPREVLCPEFFSVEG